MTQQDMIDSIDQFVAREIAPTAAQVDRTGEFPADRWRKLGESGLAGLVVPAALGGVEAERDTVLAAFERVAAACTSTAWVLLTHSTVAAAIAALGSEAQKQRYLPALARAERIGGTLAVTETGGGSNPASIQTVARREGDVFVLEGSKFFISQAGAGDVYLVLARSEQAPGPQALSCFVVGRGDAGLRFGQREDTVGLRGVQVREMFFDACRLPADRLLGAPGAGLAVLGATAGVTSLGVSAAALGVAQAVADATLAQVRERSILGQPLAAHPAVQARVARISVELAGARAWLAQARQWLESGAKGPPLPLWMAKVAITEAAARVVEHGLALHGALGYSRALPLERHSRDVRAFGIHWGHNDVLMDMVGKTVLA